MSDVVYPPGRPTRGTVAWSFSRSNRWASTLRCITNANPATTQTNPKTPQRHAEPRPKRTNIQAVTARRKLPKSPHSSAVRLEFMRVPWSARSGFADQLMEPFQTWRVSKSSPRRPLCILRLSAAFVGQISDLPVHRASGMVQERRKVPRVAGIFTVDLRPSETRPVLPPTSQRRSTTGTGHSRRSGTRYARAPTAGSPSLTERRYARGEPI